MAGFADYITAAYGTAQAAGGVGVTYQRKRASAAIAAALAGTSTFTLDDGSGVIIQVESWDWIINTADLVLDGKAIEPAVGDQIMQTIGGKAYTYEVMRFGNEPHYRPTDQFRARLRIHTKLVKAE